jgi:hypothetical protein
MRAGVNRGADRTRSKCYFEHMWGCIKAAIVFVATFVIGWCMVFVAIVIAGQCVGPPSPDQQLWSVPQ